MWAPELGREVGAEGGCVVAQGGKARRVQSLRLRERSNLGGLELHRG